MALNNEKLKALPFLDYLKKIKEYLKEVSHTPKSNLALKECKEIGRNIESRCIIKYNLTRDNYHKKEDGSLIHSCIALLDRYKYHTREKGKDSAINDFKDSLSDDIDRIIYNVQNP